MTKPLAGLAILVLAVGAAAGQTAPGAYTVGDLALRLASAVELQLEEPIPSLARTALATMGIHIDGDLKAPLVEQDAVAVFNQLGFHLATSNPTRPVSGKKVEMLVKLIQLPLTLPVASAPPAATQEPASMPDTPPPGDDGGG